MNKQVFETSINITAEIKEAEQAIEHLSKEMAGIWKHSSIPTSYLKDIEGLRERVEALKELTESGVIDTNSLKDAKREFGSIKKEIHDTTLSIRLMSEEQKKALMDPKIKKALSDSNKLLLEHQALMQKIADRKAEQVKVEQKLNKVRQDSLANSAKLEKLRNKEGLSENATKLEQYDALMEQRKIASRQVATGRAKGLPENSPRGNALTRAQEELGNIDAQISALGLAEGAIAKARQELSDWSTELIQAEKAQERYNKDIEDLTDELNKIKKNMPSTSLEELKTKLKTLGVAGIDSAQSIEDIENALKQLEAEGLREVNTACEKTIEQLHQMGAVSDTLGTQLDNVTDELDKQNEAFENKKALLDRIKAFVGLQAASNVMRRAFNDAISTVKELDEVMTEMAVVTDSDISDYWEQLPEYTANANDLGATIRDVYKASTLYYQQGLKTADVTALANSTLKMARISGLDAADATDRMTAALRGFNMELNEANAERVADVYSELAAVTASDVDEISAAMTKTASIAASAGMEFETTAAFLAQIIETTRESPETAGTALKTVIARFQELKKDPSEIGEVDGEIVDANKIETALRSVGVALRDTNGQFRDLDDVFLELASKWDTLDTNTQRYIATIAAGSRQQSRFIAMMSDYSRTQELVQAANDSAGASNAQFEKTMDSLVAKLNQLKNAWDSFTMDLADDELIKAGVDLLTKFITMINELTNKLGPFSGVAKIALLFGGFILAAEAVTAFKHRVDETHSILKAFLPLSKKTKKNVDDVGDSFQEADKDATKFNFTIQKMRTQINKTFTDAKKKVNDFRTTYNTVINSIQQIDFSSFTSFQTSLGNVMNALLGVKDASETMSESMNTYQTIAQLTKETNNKLTLSELLHTASLKLTEEQLEDVNFLQGVGIGLDVAKILVTRGLTKATYKLAEAKLIATGLTITEATAMLTTSMAAQGETWALEDQTNQTNKLNASKGALVALTSGTTIAMSAEAVGSIIAAAATALFGVAVDTACPPLLVISAIILLVVAALALLVIQLVICIAITVVFIAVLVAIAAALVAVGVAATAAAIAFVALLKEWAKTKSLDARLQRVVARLEELKEATDAAKEEAETFKEQWDKYNDNQSALDGLIQGTEEWTQALLEANQQVLELLTTYPKLAKYLQQQGGRLVIAEEGWQTLLDEQQARITTLQLNQLSTQSQLAYLDAERERNEAYKATGGYDSAWGHADKYDDQGEAGIAAHASARMLDAAAQSAVVATLVAGLNTSLSSVMGGTAAIPIFGPVLASLMMTALPLLYSVENLAVAAPIVLGLADVAVETLTYPLEKLEEERYTEFARRMNETGTTLEGSSKEEVRALYKEVYGRDMTDKQYKNMMDNADAFREFSKSLNEADIQMRNYTRILADMAAEQAGVSGSKAGEVAADLIGSGFSKEQMTALKEEKKSEISKLSKDEQMSQYAELMGWTYKDGKMYKTQELSEMTSDNEVEVNQSAVTELLAEELIKKEMTKMVSEATDAISEASINKEKKDRDRLYRIASGDVSRLTSSDLALVKEAGGFEAYLSEQGVDTSKLNIDFSEVEESLADLSADNSETLREIASAIEMADTKTLEAATSGLTSENTKRLQTQLENISKSSGKEAAKNTVQAIADFEKASGLSSETMNVVKAQLANTDLTNPEAIRGLSDSLVELGEISEEEALKLNVFEEGIIMAALATQQLNVEAIQTFASSIEELLGGIAEGNREISKEQHKLLKEAGADMSKFVETAEGFRYLGTTGELLELTANAANKELNAIQRNFNNFADKTSNSLNELSTTLDEEVKSVEPEQTSVDAWSAIGIWFSTQWETLVEVLKQLWNQIVVQWTDLLEQIYQVGLVIDDVIYKVWDFLVADYIENWVNRIIYLMNGLGELVVFIANTFIKLRNSLDVTGQNQIKEIDPNDYHMDYVSFITSEEIQENRDETAARLKASNDLKALAQNATDAAASIKSLADSASAFSIVSARESAKQKYDETWQAYQAELAKAEEKGEPIDPQIKEDYESALKAIEGLIDAYDTAFISKGMKYTDLAPLAQKVLYAREQGNEQQAVQFETDLINALNKRERSGQLSYALQTASDLSTEIQKLGKESDAASKKFEQMAYAFGFKDINAGAELLRDNFDLIQKAIAGDAQAWSKFQDLVAASAGLEGDITDQFLKWAKSGNINQANTAVDTLLGSGAYVVQQNIATEEMEVTNWVEDEEHGGLKIDEEQATKKISAGESYTIIAKVGAEAITGFEVETPESTYDQIWEQNEKINKTIRDRNKLEQEYQDLLDDEEASYNELYDKQQDLYKSLEEEGSLLSERIAQEKDKLNAEWQKGADKWSDYATLNQETLELDIDQAKYEAMSPQDKAEFNEFISNVLDARDAVLDTEEAIRDNSQAIRDRKNGWKDAAVAAEEKVRDAIVAGLEKQIEAMSSLNEAITEAQSKVVDAIQKEIDAQRELRENEETEQEIADSSRYLNLLRADTSANAMDILQAEKDLEDQKQDYEDTLIDQHLAKIQEANELAAEQREKQIQLASDALEVYRNSEDIWNDAQGIIVDTLQQLDRGASMEGTWFGNLLQNTSKLPAPSDRPTFWSDWADTFAQADSHYNNTGTNASPPSYTVNIEGLIGNSSSLTFTFPAYKTGGLADFTGPAWLDGTKARPELVLNQRDTRNFLALRDILAEVMQSHELSSTSETENRGDNYFSIDIHVDSIEGDYDVEQMAERIRSMIYEDAMGRNVNTLNQSL